MLILSYRILSLYKCPNVQKFSGSTFAVGISSKFDSRTFCISWQRPAAGTADRLFLWDRDDVISVSVCVTQTEAVL